ncbi:MAG: hypothetical protein DMD85_02315 [Candidatus Rokuibacteriota bacterium]|nr:MAG: hypothetical protein DMD85_02315 [Candidatus Rokubacteria bacterium]
MNHTVRKKRANGTRRWSSSASAKASGMSTSGATTAHVSELREAFQKTSSAPTISRKCSRPTYSDCMPRSMRSVCTLL